VLPSNTDGSASTAVLCGFAVFVGQFLFIVGLKLSNSVTASVWQPSQPIVTLLLAAAVGREVLSKRKVSGAALAFLGCAFMVVVGSGSDKEHGAFVPHVLFFGNCLGNPVYLLASKGLVAKQVFPTNLHCILAVAKPSRFAPCFKPQR
jgi:drug/metabolite transporter (DMT)-like permease